MLVDLDGKTIGHMPTACEFKSNPEKWPPEIVKLFDEAVKVYAAGAFTAASMLCRKVLMNCACHENAAEGLKFVQYADYITDTVLTFPRAKESINAIKKIGNEANHHVDFVSADDAKRAMQIVVYMLDAIYSFPAA